MREARELQTQIEQLERHIAHLDKQLQDVVLAKPKMPTKIIGPNLEEILNAAGFYRGDAVCCNDYEKCIKPCTPKGRWLAEKELRKEWVGLTEDDIKGILDCGRGGLVDIKKAEQILRDKNT